MAEVAVQQVFWPLSRIQVGMDFLQTLTPDEGVLLLAIGALTLLAFVGLVVWVLVR